MAIEVVDDQEDCLESGASKDKVLAWRRDICYKYVN